MLSPQCHTKSSQDQHKANSSAAKHQTGRRGACKVRLPDVLHWSGQGTPNSSRMSLASCSGVLASPGTCTGWSSDHLSASRIEIAGKYLFSLTWLLKRGQYNPVAGSELMPTHKDTRAQGCSSRVNSRFHELCHPAAHRRVNFAALLHTGHACNKTKCSRGRG